MSQNRENQNLNTLKGSKYKDKMASLMTTIDHLKNEFDDKQKVFHPYIYPHYCLYQISNP